MTRLVVNGCSYINHYANGGGHVDLAQQLNIPVSHDLSFPGSCNSRIIRTTLKDSYHTEEKTLYILGLTFLSRGELPINANEDPFEGKWVSSPYWEDPGSLKLASYWVESNFKKYIYLKNRTEISTVEDCLEQLMYLLLGMVGDLLHRGHQVLVFRQPDDVYNSELDNLKFAPLTNCVNIVDGLKWAAIPWQANNNAKFVPEDIKHPTGIRHVLSGEHGPLNKFLIEYIKKHALYLPVL